jgi:hypothetical protein
MHQPHTTGLINRRQLLSRSGAWGVGTTALFALGTHAAVLMDIEQAQRQLWQQAESFHSMGVTLGERELTFIAQQSETRVPKQFSPRVWEAMVTGKRVGWVVVDRVIGKYDLIDYAAGFGVDGVVTGVEILAYRESHGGEIRQPAWRRQFKGRKGPQSMRFGDDIKNISGATLSCQHVTEGIQRLSALVGLLNA